MKKFIFVLAVLTSLSSLAQTEVSAGNRYKTSVDWDRIEKGLSTGDFSCKGECMSVSIDWKEVWLAVTGKQYRDQRKADIAYCISEYRAARNALDEVIKLEKMCTISADQAHVLTKIHESSLETVDIICVERLGKRKAKNLKSSILNQ